MAIDQFPKTIVIIGAGVFGLSTSLAISKRYPSTEVTVIDRLTPPVVDGSSVDTTRCIRSDYADPIYARLAKQAQELIESDPELQPHVHNQGMTYTCDGEPNRFTDGWKATLELSRKNAKAGELVEMHSQEEVFKRIHGADAHPPSAVDLGRKPRWNEAYCNLKASFIDARGAIQVYYERCLQAPSVRFRCGSAVDHIDIADGVAKGVVLEDGSTIGADAVIVAAGAWSCKLVNLSKRVYPIGHEVVWFKLTPEEETQWKHMSISTNMSTGLNIFPPHHGEIKVLRRSPGYKNTVTVPDPDDRSQKLTISYPRTTVSHPTDVIPADAEAALRADLREIMPPLADRPFDRTKISWISTTPTADFLVSPHPKTAGIHLATGGSAHAWKFLPIIGDYVVDSMTGVLPQELVDKWAFERFAGGKDQNAPRMDGTAQELRDVVRSGI